MHSPRFPLPLPVIIAIPPISRFPPPLSQFLTSDLQFTSCCAGMGDLTNNLTDYDPYIDSFSLLCVAGDLIRVKEAFESQDYDHQLDSYAVGYAAQADQIHIMRYLLENRTPVIPWAVVAACKGGFLPALELFVEYGWNPREEGHLQWRSVSYHFKGSSLLVLTSHQLSRHKGTSSPLAP
jgi:hypothetical protein